MSDQACHLCLPAFDRTVNANKCEFRHVRFIKKGGLLFAVITSREKIVKYVVLTTTLIDRKSYIESD